LEGLSKPNGILLSEHTYNLVHKQVSCHEGKPVRLKGISGDIVAYEVADYSEITPLGL
jgi:class 3 adenylate cyclase